MIKMTLRSVLRHCEKLVSEGHMEQAIKTMLDFKNGSDIGDRNETDLILMSARYNEVHNERLSGVISYTDAKRESNSITSSFLRLLKRIETDALPDCRITAPDTPAPEEPLRAAMIMGNIPLIMEQFNAIISGIPYDHWKADSESVFHIIVHLSFKKMGADIYSELHSSKGRCDLLIKTPAFIYVIELKLDGTAQAAIDQINRQRYLDPFLTDGRMKIAIGISFSSADRKIAEYLHQIYPKP